MPAWTSVPLWTYGWRMRLRTAFIVSVILLAVVAGAFAWQKPFREYPGVEYDNFPLPKDYQEKTEWVFARLMYPAIPTWGYRGNPDWKHGAANWTIDYPRSDRHLAEVIRRLTRVQARSVEQPVDLDDGDDVFNYPWLYAVEVGFWDPTEDQAKKLREYLLRGGFFMTDDFHGTQEWAVFTRGMKRVFPDRPIVDIPNDDPIFHVLYDLSDRFQVPGAQFLYSGRIYEKDGFEPRWRGIYDDNGRVMVAMCHNMDLGDSWEWADDPRYPEKFSSMGMKIATNYVVYAMTH
jgi:hypothetical protein